MFLYHREDNDGWTPLHWAARTGHLEVVKKPIAMSAMDAKKKEPIKKWTPRQTASCNDHGEIIELLEPLPYSPRESIARRKSDYITCDGCYCLELGEAVGALLTSPLSEISGRAPVYNVTNTIFVIFSVASGLSTSPGMLIGSCLLKRMGDASISLNSSIAGDLFIQEERGLPIAILSFPPLIGPVLGPIIGGYPMQSAGWRWAFWFSAMTGGIFEIVSFSVFRETCIPQILRGKPQNAKASKGDGKYDILLPIRF